MYARMAKKAAPERYTNGIRESSRRNCFTVNVAIMRIKSAVMAPRPTSMPPVEDLTDRSTITAVTGPGGAARDSPSNNPITARRRGDIDGGCIEKYILMLSL